MTTDSKKKPLSPEHKKECDALNKIYLSKKRELKLTQSKIAAEADISTAAISFYLGGVNPLNLSIASIFSKMLQVPISEFSPRLAREANLINVINRPHNFLEENVVRDRTSTYANHQGNVIGTNGPSRSFNYPEISEVEAGHPAEAIDLLQPGEGERHQSDAWAGESGFWLKVSGDSMTRNGSPSFPEGMLVLVYPGLQPQPKQFIVAKLKDKNEVTFKQYIVDAGVSYLKPLNSAYQQQLMDDRWELIGTVVDAKWPKSIF